MENSGQTPSGNPDAVSQALPRPKRGDLIEITIDDWGDKGRGIGRYGNMVVMTDRGVPGDRVDVCVTSRKRRHLLGSIVQVLTPSPHRVEPRCKHFGVCGGCRLQDLAYEQQLADKARHVREQLHRVGKFENLPEIPIIGCDPHYRYRNKMEFSFGGTAGHNLKLGLHPRNNYRDAFHLDECWLTHEAVAEVVNAICAFLSSGSEEPYDPVMHTGFLRFVVIRIGVNTNEMLVNVVTADRPWPRAEEFGPFLQTECPQITTALWTVNGSRANIAAGDVRGIWFGPGHLTERLGPFEFEIAPLGFFQTNTRQAERLFAQVIEWAVPEAGEEVLDLYSGAGAISLFLSQRAGKVTGVEVHEESVAAAERNADRNGITNCEFVAADVLKYVQARASDSVLFPGLVVDPPRAGLHPKAIKTILAVSPPRIVYVSCNPAALARDLELLTTSYNLSKIVAVDMFPHTPHVEAVALIEKREN